MLNSKLINSPRGALPIKTKTKSQSSMVMSAMNIESLS
jgi:hypothetical protein|nr:MAG TPA: hypothetical protein [Caudoviricetes sp.]